MHVLLLSVFVMIRRVNIKDVLLFQEGPQRKKRKSEAGQVEEKADLLAMGTAAGSVLIYSTAKGALHCTLVSLRCPGLYTVPYGSQHVRRFKCHFSNWGRLC